MKQPSLYFFVGYPGAGKTTVSRIIEEHTGAKHLWADKHRLKLFEKPTHSQAESDELYAQLNAETDRLLRSGASVIFDTNFNHRHDRDYIRSLAARYAAKVTLIWVNTPLKIAKQRAIGEGAQRRNGYEEPMSAATFDGIASRLEPPTEDENPLKIDCSELDEQSVIQLLGL